MVTGGSTIKKKGVIGNIRYSMGTWTGSTHSTSTIIDTGLGTCDIIHLTQTTWNTTEVFGIAGALGITTLAATLLPAQGTSVAIQHPWEAAGTFVAYNLFGN